MADAGKQAEEAREATEAAAEAASRSSGSRPLPPVDFSTLVLSLGTTALHQMGLVPDAETGETEPADPLVAKQTIDTLEMLRVKTLGNLDEEERKLLDSLLYELRMRFVEHTR